MLTGISLMNLSTHFKAIEVTLWHILSIYTSEKTYVVYISGGGGWCCKE